ncbi:MAG: protocatechuate 3,4-dioxygenase [Alcaligenaceae bacterium]|nr:protocatechuate 3,4-dioxygenase [Alcaligenaceae bacterium]
MDRKILEAAILKLGQSPDLLAQFKADPIKVGATLGLDEHWSDVINRGERNLLRSAGVNDGVTILVSRWFQDNLADSTSSDKFVFDGKPSTDRPSIPKSVVFAGGCSHVPDLLARPEIDPEDAVERLKAAYARLRDALAEAKPDVVVVTTDCHFQSFETGAFVVGVSDQHTGSMEFFKRPDLDLTVQGDPDFAQQIVQSARDSQLEVEAAPAVNLDHGLIVPLRQVLPTPDTKVIPIVTQPARTFSPFGARAFGEALRNAIEGSGKRVALLATGGLSHWLDPGKFGAVDTAFDDYILRMLENGRGLDLANLEPYPLLDHGQYEFLNWLIVLGALGPGVRAQVYAYEPLEASGGGWTVVNMNVDKQEVTHA